MLYDPNSISTGEQGLGKKGGIHVKLRMFPKCFTKLRFSGLFSLDARRLSA